MNVSIDRRFAGLVASVALGIAGLALPAAAAQASAIPAALSADPGRTAQSGQALLQQVHHTRRGYRQFRGRSGIQFGYRHGYRPRYHGYYRHGYKSYRHGRGYYGSRYHRYRHRRH